MIRLANVSDAAALLHLNELFNGIGETTLQQVQQSLQSNAQEIVVVAEEKGELIGFVCIQLKRSFCYDRIFAEVTEVFVKESWRGKEIALAMLQYGEGIVREREHIGAFTLLTGEDNTPAIRLYEKAGYMKDQEIHFEKEIEG
jgi:ribosomal protein S18 acetylase RimI-like enzyme